MHRLLIVRLGSLGDLVHTLPAVAALRRAHPGAVIDWLVDKGHRSFLDLVPVLSGIVPLRNRTMGAWMEARRILRARDYDVALDFQGLIKSAALSRLSGAKRVLGFNRRALRESLAAPFYTQRIAIAADVHVIQKNLALARAAGATTGALEFPLNPVESPALTTIRSRGITAFALVNPGAAWPNKRWPPTAFGRLARTVHERHGLRSVVLWGPGESKLAEEVAATSAGAAIAAPATTIPDLVALSRAARLMISGDTGPLHIASAVGVPAMALFGPTNPRRNGPWLPIDVCVSRYESCDCHYERRCRRPSDTWCLGTVAVDEAVEAVDRVLAAAAGSRA
jgi:heptosyltransferase I